MKMRSLLPAALLLTGMAGGLLSCSEDFDVVAPYKPFTVVYGVLDAADTSHYVRIQKAFADPNISALDLAKVPDSSYFANLAVTLQELSSNGTPTGAITTLNRVALAGEGLTKDGGQFFTTPSYAYKFTRTLTPGSTYRLLIQNLDDGHTDTAQTGIVDLDRASLPDLMPSPGIESRLELTPTTRDDKDPIYRWRIVQYPPSPTVKFMDATMRFRYVDVDAQGNRSSVKSFDYIFSRPVRQNTTTWLPNTPVDRYNNIYAAIGNSMGTAPAGTTRLIDSTADFIAAFGSPELYTFQQNQATLGGLAGDQIQYRYTNIQGKDVLGIFASRGSLIRRRIAFTAATIEELKTNPNTVNAKITGVIQ